MGGVLLRWAPPPAMTTGGAAGNLVGSAVMQMVERPWGITAFGAASVKAIPDLVRVRFKIVRVEQAPAAAFEAARAERVQEDRPKLAPRS